MTKRCPTYPWERNHMHALRFKHLIMNKIKQSVQKVSKCSEIEQSHCNIYTIHFKNDIRESYGKSCLHCNKKPISPARDATQLTS